jgi:hypothetical protein
MTAEQIAVGRCYRIFIEDRLLIARVIEIRPGADGVVRWTVQGIDPRHSRTESLAKFTLCAEAEVRC